MRLLISGKASTMDYIGEPRAYKTHSEAIKVLGENELTDAFKVALSMGVEDIWLLNMQEQNDHIDFVEILENIDPDFYAPIDIYIDSDFYDMVSGRRMTYVEDYIKRVSGFSKTIIIYTYKHASLYEDIDSFLNENKRALNQLMNVGKISHLPSAARAVFILNNLMNYPYANVVLASMLAMNDVREYPSSRVLGNSVFDLSIEDIGDREMVYFRSNIDGEMAPENLLNLSNSDTPIKNVMIDLLIRHIDKTIDLGKYIGRLNRPYIQSLIKNDIDKALNRLKSERYIIAYNVVDVSFVKEKDFTYTVRVNSDLQLPTFTERINVSFEGDE